jgi:hypothetical protein
MDVTFGLDGSCWMRVAYGLPSIHRARVLGRRHSVRDSREKTRFFGGGIIGITTFEFPGVIIISRIKFRD